MDFHSTYSTLRGKASNRSSSGTAQNKHRCSALTKRHIAQAGPKQRAPLATFSAEAWCAHIRWGCKMPEPTNEILSSVTWRGAAIARRVAWATRRQNVHNAFTH